MRLSRQDHRGDGRSLRDALVRLSARGVSAKPPDRNKTRCLGLPSSYTIRVPYENQNQDNAQESIPHLAANRPVPSGVDARETRQQVQDRRSVVFRNQPCRRAHGRAPRAHVKPERDVRCLFDAREEAQVRAEHHELSSVGRRGGKRQPPRLDAGCRAG